MVVVVDANILISACLKINGRLANLIFTNTSKINFVIPEFVLLEIKENEAKIYKSGKITRSEFNQNLLFILSELIIIKDDEITDAIFKQSFELTENIDPKDTIFITLAISLDALLWTGDLKLLSGLKKKGFNKIITTLDFEQILKGL